MTGMETELAAAAKTAVVEWMRITTFAQQCAALGNPADLGVKLADRVKLELYRSGSAASPLRQAILQAPYFHLKQVFDPADLPKTPESFTPVPDTSSTVAARAVVLAVLEFLRMECVSYGTENGGALFVNLVPLSGEGKNAEKSKRGMRGHTDAVSFPFNGDMDFVDQRIAPSPDLIALVGLRNPDSVATKVIVLDSILAHLSEAEIAELKKPQFSFSSQATFVVGMKELLSTVHTAIDEPIIKATPWGPHVRFSHSAVLLTEHNDAAQAASDKFEAACSQVSISVVVEPGDLLILSNRTCLHGRDVVGNNVGGETRWLIRSYGLETSELDPRRRHLGGRPRYVLYP